MIGWTATIKLSTGERESEEVRRILQEALDTISLKLPSIEPKITTLYRNRSCA